MTDNAFTRTEMLIGKEAMQNIRQSTVMIVGLGAVGGYVLEILARAGIENFILIDFDEFELSNLNRQIIATEETVGMKKTDAAIQRINAINPSAKITALDMFVNSQTIPQIIEYKPDIIIDAIDALNPKCDLLQACSENNIFCISSMGAALKTDISKIKYGKLSDTKNCALAKFVRKRLKHRNIDIKKINCVFSDEQKQNLPTAINKNSPNDTSIIGRHRNIIGSLPSITAAFGINIAHQTIFYLISKKK